MKKSLILIFLIGFLGLGQEAEKEKAKALKESKNLTWDGNRDLSENKFVEAEIHYRKAISKSAENHEAPYNLGNAYYNKGTYGEAFGRYKQAGELATDKTDKHMAFHNMGNVFMKRKEYEKSVEAYKEALRNNPKDEETRYNLALAKEMLKKEQDEQKNDQKDDNKENQDQEDQKEQNQDQDKDKDDQGDQGDNDQQDQPDQGDEKEEENKEGDGDQKEEQKKQPDQSDKPNDQQQRPNQLSKQQIQNLLDAMQNEEKKVQEKIDAQKVKGVKVKNEKDW